MGVPATAAGATSLCFLFFSLVAVLGVDATAAKVVGVGGTAAGAFGVFTLGAGGGYSLSVVASRTEWSVSLGAYRRLII